MNTHVIGPYMPTGSVKQGTYVGDAPRLVGCRALVGDCRGITVAQFDRPETGYGYGWHSFKGQDFEYDI